LAILTYIIAGILVTILIAIAVILYKILALLKECKTFLNSLKFIKNIFKRK